MRDTAELSAPTAAIREIPMSRGDLALVLGGYKTAHFVSHELRPGELTCFICGEGEETIRIPVRIQSVEENHRNAPLTNPELKPFGRVLGQPAKERKPTLSAQTLEKQQRKHSAAPARASAKAFLAAEEPALKTEYFASDFDKTPRYAIHFQREMNPDMPRREVEKWLVEYRRAYAQLEKPIRSAHGYLHPVASHLEDVPTEDFWQAIHFLRKNKKPFSVDAILSDMREPIERLSAGLRVEPSTATFEPVADRLERQAKLISEYPAWHCSNELESTVGRTGLLAMGAISRLAYREPIAFKQEATANHEHRAILHATRSAQVSGVPESNYIDLPIMISNHAEPHHSGDLTDAIAHQHGYRSKEKMRRALELNPGEECEFYSYPARVAYPHELCHNDDRGKHQFSALMERVYDVWKTKGDSILRAEKFLATLPEKERQHATWRILPDRLLRETDLFMNYPHPVDGIAHPAEVRLKLLPVLPKEAYAELKLPEKKKAPSSSKRSSWSRMKDSGILEGEGWAAYVNPDSRKRGYEVG